MKTTPPSEQHTITDINPEHPHVDMDVLAGISQSLAYINIYKPLPRIHKRCRIANSLKKKKPTPVEKPSQTPLKNPSPIALITEVGKSYLIAKTSLQEMHAKNYKNQMK